MNIWLHVITGKNFAKVDMVTLFSGNGGLLGGLLENGEGLEDIV
jgi:hypothetical protein